MRLRQQRSGVVIIIVLGITFLMAAMVLSLLMKSRLDASQSRLAGCHSKARMMLGAACNYIKEC